MIVRKCLKVSGGILALADLNPSNIPDITEKDVSINLVDYGLLIKIGLVEVPIPEALFEFIIENRRITIYPWGADNLIEEPALAIQVSKEALIEAKGIYCFWKKSKNGTV
jgi:hypothetical protein